MADRRASSSGRRRCRGRRAAAPVRLPSSESASAKPIEIPAPSKRRACRRGRHRNCCGGKGGREQGRQRRDRAVHEAGKPGLDDAHDEEPAFGLVFLGADACRHVLLAETVRGHACEPSASARSREPADCGVARPARRLFEKRRAPFPSAPPGDGRCRGRAAASANKDGGEAAHVFATESGMRSPNSPDASRSAGDGAPPLRAPSRRRAAEAGKSSRRPSAWRRRYGRRSPPRRWRARGSLLGSDENSRPNRAIRDSLLSCLAPMLGGYSWASITEDGRFGVARAQSINRCWKPATAAICAFLPVQFVRCNRYRQTGR